MKKIVVLSGAGISAESGISTFRDSDGLWENHNVEDVATIDGWYRNPKLIIDFYNERRTQLEHCEPNDAHKLVAKLEEKYDVTVVTQNVDNLHERGGSSKIIHLHGELTKACNERKTDVLDIGYKPMTYGERAKDGSLLRPFIVWFGEAVPLLDAAVPVPKLVVFYNGTIDQPDEKTLRLSESFPEDADADIEVKVRMLNVNVGRNKELLDACKPLGEYSWLVDEVRRNNTTKDEEGMSSAIDKAISSMPDDYVIKPFLEAHRAEVKGMLLTEYNEAEQMELFKEDGRREGRAEGIIETLISLVKDGILSIKDAAKRAGITETAFEQKMAAK